MTDIPPPCHRCGQPRFEHDFTDVQTCSGYLLPGSIYAAWWDFECAIRAFIKTFLGRR